MLTAGVVLGSLATAIPLTAAASTAAPPVPVGKPVTGITQVSGHHTAVPADLKNEAPPVVSWPAAGSATVDLATATSRATSAKAATTPAVRATGLPLWAQSVSANATSVEFALADRQAAARAGVDGVILTATPTIAGGTARVGVDYSGFTNAYGGNYGARLHLVALPACALTTPQVASCRTQTPLVSSNDITTHSVSTVVTFPAAAAATGSASRPGSANAARTATPMVLAATAGTSSGSGTYSATSLKPAGSWTAGGSSGSFTYNYPITVPPAVSSLVPDVALSYDSGSVDGQTASTQTQSSWIGDGWSGPESFVEQSFVSCSDSPEGSPSPVSTQDSCYAGPVLTLSLKGSTESLVYDASQHTYRPANNDGSIVTQVTSSSNGSGTYNTAYWTVTERDGTTYQFGRNELPGWTSGKPTTNSVASEPVYSAHPDDPCYNAAGFTQSVCTMAYRWNLDYVTDVHHNAMAYYYQQDINYYGEDNGAANVPYVRDTHLDHIDYGFTDPNAYAAPAPNEVVFTTGDRCVSGTCDPLNQTTASNWFDVPYDLNCAPGTACASHGPSDWSTVRLTGISTQQYSSGAGKYVPVDSWTLAQSMPAPGDGTRPTLWLASITHTGTDTSTPGASGAVALPAVSFAPIPLQNRVDTAADPTTNKLVPLDRYRISAVTSETGSTTGVVYSPTSECTGPVTYSPSANNARCYPMSWTPPDYGQPIIDWFHKYVVTGINQSDNTAGQPTIDTTYTYLGGGAWHYDDNEVVQPKYRTYGQWRGYGEVQVRTGAGHDPLTLTDTTYYRGMDGDTLPTGTRSVVLTDSQGGQHADSNQLAGDTLEATNYLGDGGPIDNSTITSYWVSTPTATRARTGLPALVATMSGPVETWSRQAVTDGGTTTWRKTETDTAYDPATGLTTHVYTHGDLTQPTQATCRSTSYAPANTTANLLGLPAEVEVDAGGCGGASPNGASAPTPSQINTLTAPTNLSRPADVISDVRTFYDNPGMAQSWPQPANPTWPQAVPSMGDASVVQQAASYAGGAFSYQTQKAAVYDSYGRPTATYDADGNKTSTAYTTTGGLTTATTTTNALQQATSTTLDPTRGLTVTSTDLNSVVTTEHYDALGRLTSVWGNNRATTTAASATFAYQISTGAPSAVTTSLLNEAGGQKISTTLFDSLLRPVQTQSGSAQGGRLLTNTFYDSHGWVVKKNNPYWDSTTFPNTTLVTAPDNLIPNQDQLTLDGLGRTVVDQSERDSAVISTTTTVHNGDRTTTIPPTGGVITSTGTDALGRTTELDQYTTAPTVAAPANTFTGLFSVTGGTTQATTYTFNHQGRPYQMIDPSGDTWSSGYNLLGQVTTKTDPDAGNSSVTYDPAGNIATTTDANTHTLSYVYDALNRKTAQYDGPTSASPRLASWTYDGAGVTPALIDAIGQLTSSSSYVTNGGTTYAYTEAATGFNVFGESTGTKVTIPTNEGKLAGTYTFSHQYLPNTGLPGLDVYPTAGGLPAEAVGYNYRAPLDLPSGLGSGSTGYVNQTSYNEFNQVAQEQLTGGPNFTYLTNTYDDHTRRLHDTSVIRTVAPVAVDDLTYTYDQAGNITAEADNRTNTTTETQCYTYDPLDRLSQAWTATDTCTANPATNGNATIGDPIPNSAYWTSWTFDPLGDRTSQTNHALPGATAGDTTTNYTYPTPGAGVAQPHTLSSTSTTGPTGSSSTSYHYDPAGNTTQRALPTGTQNLTWTDTGKLSTLTSPAGTTSYVYDANGGELLRHDPAATTLFLPGEELVLTTSTNVVTGTRFYALPGGGQAQRTGNGTNYTYEITDQHATSLLSLDNTAQNPTFRQETPYGAPRGTPPTTWPDQHGFLDKPTDTTTGLVDVGARAYDPTTGRFTSLDPILNPTDPQSMTGYTYANANPVTSSDPSGLMMASCVDGCHDTGDPFALPGGGVAESNVGVIHPNPVPPPSKGKHSGHGSTAAASSGGGGNGAGQTTSGCITEPYAMGSGGGVICSGAAPPPAPPARDCSQFGYMVADACDTANAETAAGPVSAAQMAAAGVILLLLNFIPIVGEVSDALAGGEILAEGGDILAGAADSAGADGAAADEGAANDAASACSHSFAGTTAVLMADGTTKPIDQVKVGDRVSDSIPGASLGLPDQTHTVTAVHVTHTDQDYTDVTINTPHGSATITGTNNHPYWDATTHTWTPANQLQIGDQLQSSNGTRVTITAIRDYTTTTVTYDLTIDTLHTYYVEAGDTPVLVHNCNDVGHANIHQFPGIKIGKSQFFDGENLGDLSNTDNVSGTLQKNGNTRFVLRAPNEVGVDRTTGMPTDVYTVIRKPDGSVLTMFPGTSPMS
jgi:RHS repeat-associated protein